MIHFLLNYFTPIRLLNRLCPEYDKLRTVVSGLLVASFLLSILPFPLVFFFPYAFLYYIILACTVASLFVIKFTGYYLTPTISTLAVGYSVIAFNILITGGLFSPHIGTLYLLLLTGFWADRKKIGHPMVFMNIIAFILIYFETSDLLQLNIVSGTLTTKQYYLLFNICITLFFGLFFSYVKNAHELARDEIRNIQGTKIDKLKEAINERTKEIEEIRQNLATDFHDETGNLLAAINHQAQILRIKLGDKEEFSHTIDNLIDYSEQLYNSSRNFIWSTHNESNNPMVAFYYLIEFGQHFFNQFDIEFTAKPLDKSYFNLLKMTSKSNRDLVAIFKEAMTNAAKHSGATEITLKMFIEKGYLKVQLRDNGRWKEPDRSSPSIGSLNMERRSQRNNFIFERFSDENGHTTVEVSIIISNA